MKNKVSKRKFLERVNYTLLGGLIVILIFYFSSIWYFNNLELQILEQQKNNSATNELISIYLENEFGDYIYSSDSAFPTDGYAYNAEKSYCVNESTLSWNGTQITVNTKGSDNCYVYFDEELTRDDVVNISGTLSEQILLHNYFDETGLFGDLDDAITYINSKTTPIFSSVATIDEGIYATEDNDGTSYYFRGAVEDNYVEFAGMLWRIIRIDGQGNIKLMLYNEDSEASSYTPIATSVYFNYTTYTADYSAGTGTTDAKYTVETWYNNNLTINGYSDYLVATNYCIDMNTDETTALLYVNNSINETSTILSNLSNDNETTYNVESLASHSTVYYYGAYYRLVSNQKPSLICNSEEIDGISEYKSTVGLISTDEIAFAGGVYGSTNSSYYLNTGYDYWSRSAFYRSVSFSDASFLVYSTGALYIDVVDNDYAVFPSVSLSSKINFTEGSGSKTEPYKIV